jgi:hypothetical protein
MTEGYVGGITVYSYTQHEAWNSYLGHKYMKLVLCNVLCSYLRDYLEQKYVHISWVSVISRFFCISLSFFRWFEYN